MTSQLTEHRYCLRDDIDLATAPTVRAELKEVIATNDAHLLIDCAALTFIDSTGIAVLLEAHHDLKAHGRYMLITNVPRQPRRVFNLLGLEDLLHYDREHART